MRSPALSGLVVLSVACLATPRAAALDLTFDERVQAQRAIERVYYAHQIGAVKPFEQAVPQATFEEKARRYLEQTVALEGYWKTPVTGAMLEGELQRMVRATQMPERLRELFSALGNDPFLAQECLARPALVDRLARNFYAYDERIHGTAQREAGAIREGLVAGRIDPAREHPRRAIVEYVEGTSSNADQVSRIELTAEELGRLREKLPHRIGEPSPVVEEREAFVVRVLLDDEPGRLRVASFAAPKRTWDSWWEAAREGFDASAARAVASSTELPDVAGTGTFKSDAPCLPDDTWDSGSLNDLPDARRRATAVWTGSAMIVWGGSTSSGGSAGNKGVNTGGRYDPATDTWAPTSTVDAPGPRRDHAAVWTGGTMLVWGGVTLAPDLVVLDTGGRYDPVSDTWTPMSTADAPEPRGYPTAVWTGSEMVVWGGITIEGANYPELDTGGRYNPANDTWTPTSLLGAPEPRVHHTAVWTGNEMVVWGGETLTPTGDVYFDDGGRYDPAADAWTPTSGLHAPQGRSNHTAVWTGDLMVIWSGSGSGVSNTGGRYDPAADSWTPTSTTGAPTARTEHTAVWTDNLMIVWGGEGYQTDTGGRYDPVADTWTPTATLNAPSERSGQAMVWTGSLVVVWGGTYGDPYPLTYFATGGRYDPATDSWTSVSSAGAPAPRSRHTAVWTGNWMVVWGGKGYPYYNRLDTGGRYDPVLDTWIPTSTAGAAAAREGHTAVWTGSLMVVWGGDVVGSDFPFTLNSGGRYDPIADTWTPTATFHAPLGRWDHTAVWTGSKMVVWGGHHYTPCSPNCGNPHTMNTGGRYDPETDTWLATSNVNVPEPRGKHTAVWTGSRMIAWGGYLNDLPSTWAATNTGGLYDPVADSWMATSTAGASARSEQRAVWTGSQMIFWGGMMSGPGGDPVDTGGRYDPTTNTWTHLSTVNAPSARYAHSAVWTGNAMIVWGGPSNTGGRYDPVADAWTPTTITGAPAERSWHTAVWTGGSMIVWGGDKIFGSPLFTGGRYVLGQSSDDDGDGLSECAGDCNDGNAAVSPGAIETCDGLDNDCTGIVDDRDFDGDGFSACSLDCNDLDGGAHAVPSEVTGLAFAADKVTLSWDSATPGAGSATVHDVATGLLVEFPVGSGASEGCLASGTAASTVEASGPPPVGTGAWYLIRGRNGCGDGSYGTASDGEPETADCP